MYSNLCLTCRETLPLKVCVVVCVQAADYSGESKMAAPMGGMSRLEKRGGGVASGAGRNNWYSPRGTRAGNRMLERGRRDLEEEEEFPRNLRFVPPPSGPSPFT